MRYWVCINNEVTGPFEADNLGGVSNFDLSSLLCPENQAGGQTDGWKPASSYPEVAAALARGPAAAKPFTPAAESPLAMTMRGTLIEDLPVETPPAEPPKELPKAAVTAAAPAGPEAPAVTAAEPEPGHLNIKMDQLVSKLDAVADNQSQLLNRLTLLENAVAGIRTLLVPEPPKRD